MKQLTLTHILRRSLLHRRARSISALVALTVSAGVATALLTLYADLDNKLHKEFRSFGANIVVTAPNNARPPTRTPSPSPASRRSRSHRRPLRLRRSHHRPRNPRRSSRHRLRRRPTPQHLVASRPLANNTPDEPPALLGQRAAQFIGNEQSVTLTFNGQPITLQGVRPPQTGGDEDSRIYIPLAAFTTLDRRHPQRHRSPDPRRSRQVEAALARLARLSRSRPSNPSAN